ncbi:CDP-alcohol phosphatidyltransferase family protein [Streptococcus pneumoniae]
MTFTTNFILLLLAWFLFFLWNLLDGVDGNLARYREQYSKDGSVVDAMAT